MTFTVHHGDSLALLRTLPAQSVHAIITDPPRILAQEPMDPEQVFPPIDQAFAELREKYGDGFSLTAGDGMESPPAELGLPQRLHERITAERQRGYSWESIAGGMNWDAEKLKAAYGLKPQGGAHWMAECLDVDQWPDNPAATPELAAQQFLDIGGTDNDDCWEAWDELQRGGSVRIQVRRWDATREIITDPEQMHDGYKPGQEWFKRTDIVREVMVSIQVMMCQ